MDMTRRELIAAGTVGAALAASGGIALAEELGSKPSGAPSLPHDPQPAKFDLAGSSPAIVTDWGVVRKCVVGNFPILQGSDAAVLHMTVKPGALREPHWHPNAWEVDWIIEGEAQLGLVNPDNTTQVVDLKPGDVGFVPRGWAHYIRNTGKSELKAVLTLGSNNPNTIGLSTMFGGMPTDTFSETLGLKDGQLDKAKKPSDSLVFVE
jgi:oxalate decarboxylase